MSEVDIKPHTVSQSKQYVAGQKTQGLKVLKPKFDRILVKRDQLNSGPIILVNNKDAPSTGVVLAVGPTAGTFRNGELVETIDVGSRVLFGSYAGRDVSTIVGEKEGTLHLIADTDVLCTIEES